MEKNTKVKVLSHASSRGHASPAASDPHPDPDICRKQLETLWDQVQGSMLWYKFKEWLLTPKLQGGLGRTKRQDMNDC